jgi:hypothetical protein
MKHDPLLAYRNNKDISVLPAGNGNATVMPSEDYHMCFMWPTDTKGGTRTQTHTHIVGDK